MSKKFTVAACCIAIIVVIVAVLGINLMSGKSYEDQLIGEWYADPDASNVEDSIFTLYSDGTCSIWGEYGTGHWSVVNENQLKLTNIYGEIINFFDGSGRPMTIVDIKNGCMTLEAPDQSMQVDFYNK